MTYKNTYIKDVENYFLSHVGKGIMLSPKEYDLILRWKSREIPKEIVFKGISKAIDNCKKKIGKNKFPKSLIYCAYFIEEEIKNYGSMNENKTINLDSKPKDFIEKILDKLAKLIKSEKRENIRKHYIEARNKLSYLIDSKEEDVFKTLEKIEEEFYESIFQSLIESEKERIITEAKDIISIRSRLMTEKARGESILAFRNEILARDYELKTIISFN